MDDTVKRNGIDECSGLDILSHPDFAGLLPPTAKKIIDAIGVEGAARLLQAFRGKRIYVPQTIPDDDTLLVKAIGRELMGRLVERLGGRPLETPTLRRAKAMLRDRQLRADRESG